MIIPITRKIKIILLNSLKRGFIDTLEMPEIHKGDLFLDFLMASGVVDEPQEDNERCITASTIVTKEEKQ